MAMLSARPKKWWSWDYALRDAEGAHVSDLHLSSWRERGRLALGGSEYGVRREGLCGPFVLEKDGAARARARKTSFWRPEFEIEYEGDRYILKKRSMWRETVVLRQGNEELGTIRHTAWYRRDARIELADRLPLVLKVFALWLTLLLWKRDAAASEGA
jgi:hypothetical protein